MSIDPEVQLLKSRRTKIVATLGPASSDGQTIARLLEAGVDVFRLNMSHGEHASHSETFARIRSAADSARRAIAVLADLSGPKIRVGRFVTGEVVLEMGESVTVTTREVKGEPGLIPSQYPALADDVGAGDRIVEACEKKSPVMRETAARRC